MSDFTSGGWDLFGIGPWVHSRGEVVRFYDLTGLHEPNSPFADLSWLDQVKGTATDEEGSFVVEWSHLESDDPNVRTVEFDVSPLAGAAYRFGMAVDPDLGDSPADDHGGYDASRKLVYAYDASGALGVLLESSDGRAISGVEQYGARRFAPRSGVEASEVGGADRIDLLDGGDDVQFVLSAGAGSGASTWRLTVLRAASVGELQAMVDANAGG